MSLAREHRMRCAAAALAAAASASPAAKIPETGPVATAYELMRAKLGQDLAQLREIQSIEKKIECKRTLLPSYDPWIEGVLTAAEQEGSRGVQDEVLVQIMIWRIDVGDFAGAMPL